MQQLQRWKPLIRIVGIVVAVVSLLTIAYQLLQALPHLRGLRINPLFGVLALLLMLSIYVVNGLLWHTILRRLQQQLGVYQSIRIWFLSQIVRYAPGNVWHLFGRAYLTRNEGIATLPLSISMVLELLHAITAGLVVATSTLPFWYTEQGIAQYAVLLVIPSLACYVYPALLNRPLAWAIQRSGLASATTTATMHIRRRDLLAVLPGYCLTWVMYGIGLYLLTNAIHPLALSALPAMTGIFAIAWVLGFLSFITPSGLGVREGILSVLFSTIMPVPIALLMTILARVWLTVAELIGVAFVLWKKT